MALLLRWQPQQAEVTASPGCLCGPALRYLQSERPQAVRRRVQSMQPRRDDDLLDVVQAARRDVGRIGFVDASSLLQSSTFDPMTRSLAEERRSAISPSLIGRPALLVGGSNVTHRSDKTCAPKFHRSVELYPLTNTPHVDLRRTTSRSRI